MAIEEKYITRFWTKVDKRGPDDCWLWTAHRVHHGYGAFGYGRKVKRANRIAYCIDKELNIEDIDGQHILHSCDNPPCCNAKHLYLGTHDDNMIDRAKKGRTGVAILTPAQVLEIRERLKDGANHRLLAEEYGIVRQAISDIGTRRNWAWL